MNSKLFIEDFKGNSDRVKELRNNTYELWKKLPLAEIISSTNLNNKIENNFDRGKRVVIVSKYVKIYANKHIKENQIDSDFEIGDSFLIRECFDNGYGKEYKLKLNGVVLNEDRFGFEKMFSASWFCSESGARGVLQGMGIKFDKSGNMIKNW